MWRCELNHVTESNGRQSAAPTRWTPGRKSCCVSRLRVRSDTGSSVSGSLQQQQLCYVIARRHRRRMRLDQRVTWFRPVLGVPHIRVFFECDWSDPWWSSLRWRGGSMDAIHEEYREAHRRIYRLPWSVYYSFLFHSIRLISVYTCALFCRVCYWLSAWVPYKIYAGREIVL